MMHGPMNVENIILLLCAFIYDDIIYYVHMRKLGMQCCVSCVL